MLLLCTFSGIPKKFNQLIPDNGLAQLAGYIQQHKHAVRILDLNSPRHLQSFQPFGNASRLVAEKYSQARTPEERRLFSSYQRALVSELRDDYHKSLVEVIERALDESQASILGIKLWPGEGASFWRDHLKGIKARRKNLKVVFGGPLIEIVRERIFDFFPEVDVAVVGPGKSLSSTCVAWTPTRLIPAVRLLWRERPRTLMTSRQLTANRRIWGSTNSPAYWFRAIMRAALSSVFSATTPRRTSGIDKEPPRKSIHR
ncbi:MAG: hypothetical protein A2V88_05935 [Elusimicrobia bacterium RBG_16_66_12]|nr:MAG: hypothetical protein A2V88_05935 [Elusimicrobia bacterium RBG_16_66_12]